MTAGADQLDRILGDELQDRLRFAVADVEGRAVAAGADGTPFGATEDVWDRGDGVRVNPFTGAEQHNLDGDTVLRGEAFPMTVLGGPAEPGDHIGDQCEVMLSGRTIVVSGRVDPSRKQLDVIISSPEEAPTNALVRTAATFIRSATPTLPGATIQIVGTNLTGATVTMCGDPVAIVSNDGTIITVVVPPGCPDGDTTITVTTPDGETTADFAVLPVPEPGECPSLTDWCAPDTPCPDCTPCVVAPPRPLIAMWADLAARIRCGWPDDRCPPGAVTVEATQQPPGSDCDAEVQVIPGGPAGADHAGVTTWGGRIVVLRPWAQINEAGQLTDAAQAQRLEAIARSLEDLQIMQQLIVAAACGACGPGGATIDRVERVTSTTTLGWAFAVRIS
jgi:hypothetical protein